ncbi:MAG: transporter [Bacteroidales bacterium]|nr:transporter [Bacteroidales bacterium]MDD4742791.1 transporter [Bacteroidales bacterium]
MKILISTLFLFFAVALQAQQQVPDLVTDRPDQTESAATVPKHFLQIETGFILENDENEISRNKSFAYNTTLLRYGLWDNFELRLGAAYLGDNVTKKNSDFSQNIAGFSPLHVGFKVKVAEEKGLRPDIAFLGGLELPFTAGSDYKPSYTAATMRFAFSHTLSDRFSLGYNLGAEWDGETAVPGYFYSVALGIGLIENLGMFVESFGAIQEAGTAQHQIDAGFTYLLTPNFQVDISGGIGLNDAAPDNFISFGLSYRIPR